jgi:hypothetical protein
MAYAIETDSTNKFTVIGYNKPNSSTFDYIDGTEAKGVVAIWKAKNEVKLNECPSAENWQLKMTLKTDGTNNKYSGGEEIEGTYLIAGNKDACEALTPSFAKLGDLSAKSSASGGE